jgi:TrmH family RNA methyltransferase
VTASTITSKNNPKIKLVRSLRGRKGRQETGLFIVEGIRPVGEAVEARAEIESVFYAPDLLTSEYAFNLLGDLHQTKVPQYTLSPLVFESIAEKENPQGLLAVVRQPSTVLTDLTPDNFPWGVGLVSPQDPGNIGTILRTIDAVGASGLILLEEGADPYHPSAVRASMGTLFWHPVVQAEFSEFSAWANVYGYHVVGTSAHASQEIQQVSGYPRPLILLLGGEREGLTEAQASFCQQLIRLPMRGKATSLNLAVAAGIFLYDMLLKN